MLDYFFKNGNLGGHILRHFLARCFVFFVGKMAECRFARVEDDRDVFGIFLRKNAVEVIHESINGACIYAFGINQRMLDECEVRPVCKCHAVQ